VVCNCCNVEVDGTIFPLYDELCIDILTYVLLLICNCCCCTRVERIYDDINASATKRSIHVDFRLNKLAVVISRITALMGILVCI
jgi:callose synthase